MSPTTKSFSENLDMYQKRLFYEWNEMRRSPLENCWAEPRENDGQIDLFTWDAIIFGPVGNINVKGI
jgi:ubiquitin-protein ligase